MDERRPHGSNRREAFRQIAKAVVVGTFIAAGTAEVANFLVTANTLPPDPAPPVPPRIPPSPRAIDNGVAAVVPSRPERQSPEPGTPTTANLVPLTPMDFTRLPVEPVPLSGKINHIMEKMSSSDFHMPRLDRGQLTPVFREIHGILESPKTKYIPGIPGGQNVLTAVLSDDRGPSVTFIIASFDNFDQSYPTDGYIRVNAYDRNEGLTTLQFFWTQRYPDGTDEFQYSGSIITPDLYRYYTRRPIQTVEDLDAWLSGYGAFVHPGIWTSPNPALAVRSDELARVSARLRTSRLDDSLTANVSRLIQSPGSRGRFTAARIYKALSFEDVPVGPSTPPKQSG